MIRMFIVYVDTSLIGNSPTTLTVVTSGAGFSRQWRIRITQIGCDSLARGKLMINCSTVATVYSVRLRAHSLFISNDISHN